MRRQHTSRNLTERLSDGVRSGREVPAYVGNVRVEVAKCRNSGSQQHRLRYLDENWLVSQHRWVVEQLAAGANAEDLIRVLEACVDEARAECAQFTPLHGDLLDAALAETEAGSHEDIATLEALAHPSPGTLQRAWDRGHAQMEALRRKMRTVRAMLRHA